MVPSRHPRGGHRILKKGHTEEEILRALREVEDGATGAAVCRKLGISEQTLYTWKTKYAGLGLSELGTSARSARRTPSSNAWSRI